MRLATPGIAVLALIVAGLPARAQQPAGPFEALACAPSDPDVAVVLAGGFVHVTRDGGASWSRAFVGARAVDDAEDEVTEAAEVDWLEALPFDADDDFDDEADEIEPEWLDGPARDQVAEENAAGRPLLAVADDGRWAVAQGATLLVGSASTRREIELPSGVRGHCFDVAGDLWIAAEGRLLRVDSGGAVRKTSVAVAGAPVRGPGGGVLVPGAGGLLLAGGTRDGPPVTDLVSLPVAGARAVAWDPARPSEALVASRGRLERITFGAGRTEGSGRAFPDADRLLADAGGGLFLRRTDGSWHVRSRAGWQRMDAADAAIDAAGRPWIAFDHGISTPAAGRPAMVGSPAPFATAGQLEPLDEPGPPPCEPVVVFPVPRVDLFFGISHGSARTATLPEETDHLVRRSWIEGGLRFTGNFGAGARADCLPRQEAWARQQDLRRRRLAALDRARARTDLELAGKTSLSRAAWLRLESQRLAELIRLMTGSPIEEQRP